MVDWNSPANTNFRERMSILNAYFFPDGKYAALYPGITPVNTFRVIFDQYLGAQYELLEDRNYFSIMDRPYAILDVTEAAQAEPGR